MTPLDDVARLLAKHGHGARSLAVRSLAAREEMRVELEAFWADVAGELFGANDPIAALELGGANAAPGEALAADRAALRRALFLVADDLSLRGVASPDSEVWRRRLKS